MEDRKIKYREAGLQIILMYDACQTKITTCHMILPMYLRISNNFHCLWNVIHTYMTCLFYVMNYSIFPVDLTSRSRFTGGGGGETTRKLAIKEGR